MIFGRRNGKQGETEPMTVGRLARRGAAPGLALAGVSAVTATTIALASSGDESGAYNPQPLTGTKRVALEVALSTTAAGVGLAAAGGGGAFAGAVVVGRRKRREAAERRENIGPRVAEDRERHFGRVGDPDPVDGLVTVVSVTTLGADQESHAAPMAPPGKPGRFNTGGPRGCER
jgi:hypothetical protein